MFCSTTNRMLYRITSDRDFSVSLKKEDTMKVATPSKIIKLPVSVNLKPSEGQLMSYEDLYFAVDTMIINDCFIDNNLMKKEENKGILFWDWTLVSVGSFTFPAPIHTCSKTESVLYTYNGREVQMSNKECAITTAIFYLTYLYELANSWEQSIKYIHPLHLNLLSNGINKIKCLSNDKFINIKKSLLNQITDKGYSVLN